MTKQELQIWFYEKMFNCYRVKHKTDSDIRYWIYDKQFIRDCKLSGLVGDKIIFPTEHTGDVLFEQDSKSKIFWCYYKIIWSFFESNYKNDYQEVKDLITEFLGEIDNYKEYIPRNGTYSWSLDLGEIDNYKGYTPQDMSGILLSYLGEIDNYKGYTPKLPSTIFIWGIDR